MKLKTEPKPTAIERPRPALRFSRRFRVVPKPGHSVSLFAVAATMAAWRSGPGKIADVLADALPPTERSSFG